MGTSRFRDRELSRLRRSGWQANSSIRSLLGETGLVSPVDSIDGFMTETRWREAERIEAHLRERFAAFRFAENAEWGLLFVPSPRFLDTRGPICARVRASMHPGLGEDFVDPELGPGVDLTSPGQPWTPFVSIVGIHGVAAGSYDEVAGSPLGRFAVDGFDTRRAMIRQLWGARLLQAEPGRVPDSDANEPWTFTLMPGESLVDGRAVSGTVLKGRVRFRLGKADRGIGSARVSPAVPL